MKRLTPKQEKFCLLYVETGNASEAYRNSYNVENMKPSSIHSKAKELLDNGRITSRINEIYKEMQLECAITVGRITRDLEKARLMAEELNQPSTMIQASNAQARLHGLITDKQELTVDNKIDKWLNDYHKDREDRGVTFEGETEVIHIPTNHESMTYVSKLT